MRPNRRDPGAISCSDEATTWHCRSLKGKDFLERGETMPTRAHLSKSALHEAGHTELMRAALEGQTETVKRLLESGANVNDRDDEGRTALMFAVANIQTDAAKALLDHGADVNVTANDGSSALMLAASSGDSEI